MAIKEIRLNDVMISYPSLFQKTQYMDETPRYCATFILNKDKDAQLITDLNNEIKRLCEEAKVDRASLAKVCLKDAADHNKLCNADEYQNSYYIKATHADRKPVVLNRDGKTDILESDDLLRVGGAFVRAYINLYMYTHKKSGTRGISATLWGVQYQREGLKLGGETHTFNREGKFDAVEGSNNTSDDNTNPFG